MPVIDSTGYNYPESLVVQDAGEPQSFEVVLAVAEEAIRCDECRNSVQLGTWAYYVDEDDGDVFHTWCLFKQPCKLGLSVLIRGSM